MKRHSIHQLAKMILAPCVLYLCTFGLFTYPAMTQFTTHFFADRGNGLQNIWNLWWVRKAVIELHQTPWHTRYLHFPYGTTLLGHTLNPFNGYLGIPLHSLFSWTVTFNLIILFSFVGGGWAAFRLAYEMTSSYPGSLLGGFIFTFCNYHFAHAEGHLQLVALEWIPIFVLLWYRFILKASLPAAAASALALLLTLLCDYYYLFYCIIAAILMTGWVVVHRGELPLPPRSAYLRPALVFLFLLSLTAGPLIWSLIDLNHRDPLLGSHPASLFSLDLLAPLIPGGHWRWADWTRSYWSRLPGNIHESSVHLGTGVTGLLIYGWLRRRRIGLKMPAFWFGLMAVSLILAMGPTMHIAGKPFGQVPMPYTFVEMAVPFLKMAGCPVRTVILAILAAAVIAAGAFGYLLRQGRRACWSACAVVALIVFEYWPKPIPLTRIEPPDYVQALRGQSGAGGVIDSVSTPSEALYYQTIHEKPLAFGDIARTPQSVWDGDVRIVQLFDTGQWERLRQAYGFRYLILRSPPESLSLTLVFRGQDASLFELRE